MDLLDNLDSRKLWLLAGMAIVLFLLAALLLYGGLYYWLGDPPIIRVVELHVIEPTLTPGDTAWPQVTRVIHPEDLEHIGG
jgi:hypothetical protein